MRTLASAVSAALLVIATPAAAQDEFPMEAGEWVEMGAISVEDGHGLDYANHLAANWRQAQEFAKSQGWITDYEVLINEFPRHGEPNVYLITRFEQFETPQQAEERGRQYRQHMQRTIAQLEGESGDRAEYRTRMGSMLLREYGFRN